MASTTDLLPRWLIEESGELPASERSQMPDASADVDVRPAVEQGFRISPSAASANTGPKGNAPFSSILFLDAADGRRVADAQLPDFFSDLNLDQIVASFTAGRDEYDLKPFFFLPLTNVDAIRYRHDVVRDMEDNDLRSAVERFAQGMRRMRERLQRVEKSYYVRQKQRWFLDAIDVYGQTVKNLAQDLASSVPKSAGILALREYLSVYTAGDAYRNLVSDTEALKRDLASIQYSLTIDGGNVTARKYAGETDYSAEVLATFERFRQRSVDKKAERSTAVADMDHVEAAILDNVAKLYPEIFDKLTAYCQVHAGYLDTIIQRFDREIQFYLACLSRMADLSKAGVGFCYPEILTDSKEVASTAGFDLALAFKLAAEKATIVTNDFYLKGKERIFVASGPNQGGKTTFARAFGQLHYLARLGCPVPGSMARLFLFDQLFVHFEREEDIQNRRGKLQDDLVRIHAILERATPRSIIIMNEIFTSTALHDAVFLGKKILERIVALDALGVCVTFMDELATLGEQTVSVVSTVVPENPAERTFHVVRHPADGLAYAMAIAQKYRLTYNDLKGRLKS